MQKIVKEVCNLQPWMKQLKSGLGSLCSGEAWNGYDSAQEKNLKAAYS